VNATLRPVFARPFQLSGRRTEEPVDLDRLWDKPVLRHVRNAVATIRALAFVMSVVASAAVLIYLAIRNYVGSPALAITLGIMLVALLAGSGYIWHYVKNIHDPPFYEIQELNGRLLVEPANDHHRFTYERRQTVIATRDDLRLIEFRAHWTGQGQGGSMQVESVNSKHAMLDGRHKEEDGRVHRWIYPRRPLKRGQPIEVGIRQVHEDDVEEQLPYFREGGGRYKTRRIIVKVQLPLSEHDPESVRGVIWNSHRAAWQSPEVGDLEVDKHVMRTEGCIEYTVTADRPRVFHSYGVEWIWGRDTAP
jgi:hypothetical protein